MSLFEVLNTHHAWCEKDRKWKFKFYERFRKQFSDNLNYFFCESFCSFPCNLIPISTSSSVAFNLFTSFFVGVLFWYLIKYKPKIPTTKTHINWNNFGNSKFGNEITSRKIILFDRFYRKGHILTNRIRRLFFLTFEVLCVLYNKVKRDRQFKMKVSLSARRNLRHFYDSNRERETKWVNKLQCQKL